MHVDIAKKSWLLDLVDALLRNYDPAAALLRLPPELRGTDPDGPSLEARARTLLVRSMRRKLLEPGPPGAAESGTAAEDAFIGPIEGHIDLALDIALVHGAPFIEGCAGPSSPPSSARSPAPSTRSASSTRPGPGAGTRPR